MRILYSPQINEGENIEYQFKGEKITAYYKGETDVFDFSQFPNGEIKSPQDDIETILKVNPIVEAYRVDGEMSVVLMYYIKHNSSLEERFPEWFEVK